MSKPKKKPSSASTNQHFETRQQILPLKTSEYFADKAQEVSAKTTLELYDKVSTPRARVDCKTLSRSVLWRLP